MITEQQLLPCGRHAIMVQLDTTPDVLAVAAAVRARLGSGEWVDVVDVVPAEQTVLITIAGTDLALLRRALLALPRSAELTADQPAEVIVPVRYDGPDLNELAALTGLSRHEIVLAHTATPWRVAFGGFAPGFAYLVGGDERLRVPRRSSPRTRVPAGSVALAGAYSAVYPRASPGGWQLIGSTDLVMWDLERDPPALLEPGTVVRFVDVDRHPAAALQTDRHAHVDQVGALGADRHAQVDQQPGLEVVATGPLALVQDRGRPGYAHLGVSPSGAADRGAFQLGARLVAQDYARAAIEVLFGGLELLARTDVTVALTGAVAPAAIDGRPVGYGAPLALAAGRTLRLGTPSAGLRTYVSVRGGLVVPLTLGSRSTDTLSGLGPPRLRAGDLLAVGEAPADFPDVDLAPGRPPSGRRLVVSAGPGPRADWLVDWAELGRSSWTVSTESDRIGVRLDGPAIARHPDRRQVELPSEGVLRGAVQLPPSGQPVIFLADQPVTGGYPVVAVVDDAGMDELAQAVPGQQVSFSVRKY